MSVLINPENKVLKSKNRVIAVFLCRGDPRLKLLTLFWIPISGYCYAIHPARAFERIPVQSSDTIEFDLDAIPYQLSIFHGIMIW